MTMGPHVRRSPTYLLAFALAAILAGCGSKEPPSGTATTGTPAGAPADATAPAAAPADAPQPITQEDVGQASWTPEALEELLAPIALYPDPVLSQVLIASTNPQEVLDAGNWLIANPNLSGKALDDAAAQAGFTPPVRALVQFPQTVDLMCMEMGWTSELGQAFVADQAGVLDAVQRLRRQAMDVGNLQTSDAMKVETEVQEGKEVVVLKPPKPEVVYVPTYDPEAVYAPAPATTAATTTTAPVEDKTKYSTGNLITTGLLAFGAGILVNEIFDDDDDHHHNNRYDYYYPNYGYGGMPYYPPYPYRPVYGNGYYPSNGYNRPPNWNGGFQNNGNIIITNPGGNGGYWDRYDNRRPYSADRRQPRSPISTNKQARPELAELNRRAPRPMPAEYKRPDKSATAANWKGQSQYAGKGQRPATAARTPQERIAEATPGYSRPAPSKGGSKEYNRPSPKVQGSYAGKDRPSTRDVPLTRDLPQQGNKATRDLPKQGGQQASRDVPKPTPKNVPAGDRGYDARDARPMPQQGNKQAPMDRPQPTAKPMPQKPTAMSGAGNRGGQMDRAASQRGKQSLPQGARSKGGGGGGGGGKNKNKQAR